MPEDKLKNSSLLGIVKNRDRHPAVNGLAQTDMSFSCFDYRNPLLPETSPDSIREVAGLMRIETIAAPR